MDKKTVDKIKKELLDQKVQIEADLKNITENKKDSGGENRAKFPNIGDTIEDNAMEISEYTTNLATEKVLESTLRDIDSTLKRIEDGSYGICKYCKKEIGEKRLLARPVASACVECKSKLQSQI